MKNKLILLTTLIAICFSSLQAKKVNERDAEQVAQQLVSKEGNQTRSTSQLTLVHTEFSESSTSTRSTSSGENVPTYYVFSKGDNKGFVIVSADDVATPILGYSDNGNYDANKLPINFESWMKGISGEIAYAIENQLEQSPEAKVAWDSYLSGNLRSLQTRSAVEPLVKTKWDQYIPYNKLCPEESLTGCVATAMAQIMKYHNYPLSSTKTIPGYTTRTNGYVIDAIPVSTYDWNSMAKLYAGLTTTKQDNAVSKLMYDCGVSVEMDYTSFFSATYSEYVATALAEYFDYDKNIEIKYRNYYNNTQWENMLIAEINANRPIYYAGADEFNSGHAFVCDGYNESGLFHFNWGWSGSYDGYYSTTALNPGTGGAGAGSGVYNLSQMIVSYIKPRTDDRPEEAPRKPELYIYSLDSTDFNSNKSVLDRGEDFYINATIVNIGSVDFEGMVGIGIMDVNDSIVSILEQPNISISGNYTYDNYNSNISIIPTDIAPGNYFLTLMVREKDSTTWTPLLGLKEEKLKVPVTITGGIRPHLIKILNDDYSFGLGYLPGGYVDYDQIFTVHANFENQGTTSFEGYLGVAIVDDTDQIVSLIGSNKTTLSLLPGESAYNTPEIECSIPDTIPAGQCKLRIVAKQTTATDWSIVYGRYTSAEVYPYFPDILTLNIVPTAKVWNPQNESTDWFDATNWTNGVPDEKSKVTIPKSTTYPILTSEAQVDLIYFGAGAELKGQDKLVYNKAFVDYDFGQGNRSKHYRTLSFPLQEGYSSDFTFDSQPTVYFKVFESDPNTQQGKFVTASGSNYQYLSPGSGFMLSVYPDKDPDKGLALSGGILRLPYFDADSKVPAEVHPNHQPWGSDWSLFSNPARTESYTVYRSEYAYKLADPVTTISLPYEWNRKELMALVGNPFMTTIDFSKLQAENNDLIKDTYQIWTKEGNVEGYVGYSPEGNFGLMLTSPLTNQIAPLQGFFVETRNVQNASLNCDLNIITAYDNGVLRSISQTDNKIEIVARNTQATARTFVAKREYGSALLGEADSRQLINELNEAPQVYTIKASETGNTLVGANITNGESAEYPIGIATTQSGQTSLTFAGMDSYDGNISFTDKVLGQTINLTGLGSYEYSFDYAPKTSGNEVVPTNDRFRLRMTSATSSINDPSDFDNNQSLVVYADKGFIHATNSNGATIKEISVYNISGVLVYQASVNASSYTTSQYFKNGVYIVKVKTDSGIDHKKVIVK